MKITKENKDIVLKILHNLLTLWIRQVSGSYYHLEEIENLVFNELKTTKEEFETLGVKIKDFLPDNEDYDFKSHFDNVDDEWNHLYDEY